MIAGSAPTIGIGGRLAADSLLDTGCTQPRENPERKNVSKDQTLDCNPDSVTAVVFLAQCPGDY